MKFYISATGGIKRVIVSNSSGGGKGSVATVAPVRRFTGRALLSVALLLGIALPLLFVRFAFLVLESAAICSSPIECIGWRFLGGNDGNHLLREELTRALLEAREKSTSTVHGMEGSVGSFEELVKEMTAHRQDIKAFAFKTKAMLSRMEQNMQRARQRESIYWHLASHGVPKSMHCLSLKLAEEYAVNAVARSLLPLPLLVDHLSDPSLHHVVLLTDNVLAASVVVSSTIKTCTNPDKFVFHIVTDKKTYSPMHAWFSINPLEAGVVEVKGLHRYDWSEEVNVGVKDMIDINYLTWQHYYNTLKQQGLDDVDIQSLEALTPTNLSLLNFLRIYIPESNSDAAAQSRDPGLLKSDGDRPCPSDSGLPAQFRRRKPSSGVVCSVPTPATRPRSSPLCSTRSRCPDSVYFVPIPAVHLLLSIRAAQAPSVSTL